MPAGGHSENPRIRLLFPYRGTHYRAEKRNLLGLKQHTLSRQPWGAQGGHSGRMHSRDRETGDIALHAGGAAPVWSPDLDAKTQEQPRHPPAPPPYTRRVLFGPPGEGAPQGRLGIELGLESTSLLAPPCRAHGPGGLVPSSPPSPHPGSHLHAQGQASAGVTEPYTSSP